MAQRHATLSQRRTNVMQRLDVKIRVYDVASAWMRRCINAMYSLGEEDGSYGKKGTDQNRKKYDSVSLGLSMRNNENCETSLIFHSPSPVSNYMFYTHYRHTSIVYNSEPEYLSWKTATVILENSFPVNSARSSSLRKPAYSNI